MLAYPSFLCKGRFFGCFSQPQRVGIKYLLYLVLLIMGSGSIELRGQCFVPGGFQAQQVTPSTLILGWTDNPYADAWELEVREGSTPFTNTPTHSSDTNAILIDNLSPATRYRARIRSLCGSSKSAWTSTILEVTTAGINGSTCGIFFRVDDDHCPAENIFYLEVDQAPGNRLGEDVSLSAVQLIIRHTFLADLHLRLISPAGKSVNLFQEHGQSRDHLGNPEDLTCTQVCRFSSTDCDAIKPLEHTGTFIATFLPDEDLRLFHDGSDPNGIWQLAICDDAKADTGSLRHLELIFEPLACAAIMQQRVEFVTDTSAYIQWERSGACDAVLVEYGPKGFTPGTGGTAGANGTLLFLPSPDSLHCLIHPLSPGGEYDVYMRSYCAPNTYSLNECALGFQTSCTSFEPPAHEEDFDGLTSCGFVCLCSASLPLNGFWQNVAHGDDFDWLAKSGPAAVNLQTGPFEDVSGNGNYMFLQTLQAACQSGATAVLQSSCLFVQPNEQVDCHMAFQYHMWGGGMGALYVEATVDGGVSWTTLWSLSGNQGSEWHKQYISLSTFRGDTIQLRIRGVSGPSRTSQMAIDEIQLFGLSLLGEPDRIYYRDVDGDGFGNAQAVIKTCSSILPAGYVTNALDCNDNNPSIFPGALEVACNGVDENCNGMADDLFLPFAPVAAITLCEGDSLEIVVPGNAYGQYYWFASSNSNEVLHTGNNFIGGPVEQDTFFYVVDSVAGTGCTSIRRIIEINMLRKPEIVIPAHSGICDGESLHLGQLGIMDALHPASTFTFHTSSPGDATNQLPNDLVMVTQGSQWWVKGTSPQGCTVEEYITFLVHPLPQAQIQSADTLNLCTGKTILLQTTVQGGMSPYQFHWSHGFKQMVVPISALPQPGTQPYYVTVTDALGCHGKDSVWVLTQASVSGASLGVTDVSVCGGSDGTLLVTPLDPGVFHYRWEGPVSGNVHNINGAHLLTGLGQGSYRITVTNSETNCGFTPAPAVVNGPGPLVKGISIMDEQCEGLNNGSISLVMEGPPATYLWSTGDTGPALYNLVPGTYSVSISGGSCATILHGLEVKAASPIFSGAIIQNATCSGLDNGQIQLALSGGTAPYTYTWAHGPTTNKVENLSPGAYSCIVSDANACVHHTDTFTIQGVAPIQVDISVQHISCHGGMDGRILLNPNGAQLPYTIRWSDGEEGEERQQLSAGVYAFTLTDSKGCVYESESIALTESDAIILDISTLRNETCSGANDGNIHVLATGGQGPFSFLWNDGELNAHRSHLASGIYALTVTDDLGCVAKIDGIIVDLEAPLEVTAMEIHHPTCDFLQNGEISLQMKGGSGTYLYQWSNGGLGEKLLQVGPGLYHVTITDSLGCSMALNGLLLEEQSPLIINLKSVIFPQCGDQSLGNIDIHVSGSEPFVYKWSNGFKEEDPTGLQSGFYSVTVSDSLGCQASLESIHVLSTNDPYDLMTTHVAHNLCHGDQQGEVLVEVTGGIGPFQFNWSTGKEKDIDEPWDGLSGLPQGIYSVTVTDLRGCILTSGPLEVKEPNALVLNIPAHSIQHESCKGDGNGKLTMIVSGGTPPYAALWFKDGNLYSTMTSPDHFIPGIYYGLVEDSQGCITTVNAPIIINGPPTLFEWEAIDILADECSSDQTGEVSLKLKGGVPGYHYVWNDGNTERERKGLEGGTYCVTATDQYQCQRDTCIFVAGGSGMAFQMHINHECDPFSSAEVLVAGGMPPFHYQWSHGGIGPVQDGLASGLYDITVTDNLGCGRIQKGIQIGHPVLYIDTIYSIPVTQGGQDGSAIVVPMGGTPPFDIQWDVNTLSQKGDTATMLVEGKYCVLVTDIYNCFDTACVVVSMGTSSVGSEGNSSKVRFFPNPVSDKLTLQLNEAAEMPSYILFSGVDGRIQQRIDWPQGESDIIMDVSTRLPGWYIIQLMDRQDQVMMRFPVIVE